MRDFIPAFRPVLAAAFHESFARFSPTHFPPAGLSAGVSIILSVLVLAANHRRPINRIWALALFFIALWQCGIAITQWSRESLFLRFGIFLSACAIYSGALLKEAIILPWRSIGSHFKRMRFQLFVVALYMFVFTRWWLVPQTDDRLIHREGPFFRILDAIAFLWISEMLIHSVYLIQVRKVTGIARSELIVLIVLLASGLGTFIGTFILGRTLDTPHAAWPAPAILVVGLSLATVLLVRNEIFDARDFRKGFVLYCTRGLIYFVVAFLGISLLAGFGGMTVYLRFIWGIALALVLAVLPLFDRKLHHLVDRQFTSQDFLDAQAAASALIEKTQQTSDIHAGYVDILKRWSDGSPEIFLSEALFIVPWPTEPVDSKLLQYAADRRWATPEILDRQGTNQEELAYLLRNHVAAMVCFTAQSGERLIAAFKTRVSERPFLSRELREAHELLRVMQLGLSFAKMSRRLLGSERLSFYAQYAPQFAHEIRNGLYLQNQLLRAIADGRTGAVLVSDAKTGLDRIEHVDRLCDHFLNIRALYDRPIKAIDLADTLSKAIDEAALRYAGEARVVFRTSIRTPASLRAAANPDLFNMAVHNILKNGVEALTKVEGGRWIEITASVYLEKVHLLIHDNGSGLPEDRRLDPFSPGMSRKRNGMGLGLSIARDCIEAMGGTIGVRSSGPEGTCFEMTLNKVSP